ncbi:Proteasome lid subunit RPN8/RPN11, contains Jab1/MPN metalloenzyme (JAMM) motif [Lachnospiraceae bacterium G41]|nr:Proteasome lid subunit RPN8/RPN11, contains Jab1/MPN metalloenzyme (JAMM) motif [Lachnospiraceae bacterium G41]
MTVTINKNDYERILAYARENLPEEACGLIAGIDREDGVREIKKVYLLTNIDHTNEHFSIDPKDQLASIKDMRAEGLKPLGNWHSHPESPSRPSEEDKRLANDSNASYLILSLEEADNPVLNAFHVESVNGEKTVRKEELTII